MKRLLSLLPLLLLGMIARPQNMTGPSGYGIQQKHIAALEFFRPPVLPDTVCNLAVNPVNGTCFGAIIVLESDSTVYMYDGAKWKAIGVAAIIPVITASNGLNKVADDIRLGGAYSGVTQLTGAAGSYFIVSHISEVTGSNLTDIIGDGTKQIIASDGGTGLASLSIAMHADGAGQRGILMRYNDNRVKVDSATFRIGAADDAGTFIFNALDSLVTLAKYKNNVAEDSVLSTDINGAVKLKALPVTPTPTLQQVTTAGNSTDKGIQAAGAVAGDWIGVFTNSAVNGHGLYANADDGIPFRVDIGANIYMQLNGGGRLLVGRNTADDGFSALQLKGLQRFNSAANNDLYIGENGSGFGLDVVQNLPFTLSTNSTERMRIAANGNVGIGITNPANKLVLPNDAYLAWKNAAGTSEDAAIRQDASNKLQFVNTGVEAMTILPGGNVGIGTTTPDAPLTVGSGNNRMEFYPANDATLGNYIQSYNRGTSAYQRLGFRAASFYFDNGNVSINATSPTNKLTIASDNNTTSTQWHLRLQGATSSAKALLLGPVTSSANDISAIQAVGTSGNAPLVLNLAGGNVAVGPAGVTAPNSQLQIFGTVSMPITVLSGNLSVGNDPHYTIINRNTSGASNTLTLPAANSCTGRMYRIVDEKSNSVNRLTFSPSIQFKGTSYTNIESIPFGLANPSGDNVMFGATVLIQSDGSNWIVVGF